MLMLRVPGSPSLPAAVGRPIRLVLWAVSGVVVIGALALGFWIFETHSMSGIARALRSVPGVNAVEISSIDGEFGKMITADVTLDGPAGRRIVFRASTYEDLQSGDHLRLDTVGPYSLYSICPDTSQPQYVDVGHQGEFPNLLPFRPRNAADLIVHYDELLSYIKKLPPAGKGATGDAKVCEYRISRD
jgi:hypothetical protein